MSLANLQSSYTSDPEERSRRTMSEKRRISQIYQPPLSPVEIVLCSTLSLLWNVKSHCGRILGKAVTMGKFWQQGGPSSTGNSWVVWLNISFSSQLVSGKGRYTSSAIRAGQELLDESLKRKICQKKKLVTDIWRQPYQRVQRNGDSV